MPRHYLEKALEEAITLNDINGVKSLIKQISKQEHLNEANKSSITNPNGNGQTFLHLAVAHDADSKIVEMLFPHYQYDIDLLLSCDNDGRSIFWYAIRESNKEVAERMFSYYQKPQANRQKYVWLNADNKKITPLHLAAESNDHTLLPWLFNTISRDDIKDYINLADSSGNTALHYTCKRHRREQIVLLLTNGASISAKNNKKKSFIDYLSQNTAIFISSALAKPIKQKILEQIKLELIINPGNDTLKNLYPKLLSFTSLADAARYFIINNCELEGKLDEATKSVLYHTPDCKELALYQRLSNDVSALQASKRKMIQCDDKIKRIISSKAYRDPADDTNVWLISFAAFFIGAAVLLSLLFLTSHAVGFILLFSTPIFVLAPFIITLCIASHINNHLAISNLKEKISQFISEAKSILGKLLVIEKKDGRALPISPENMRLLENNVHYFNDFIISEIPGSPFSRYISDIRDEMKTEIVNKLEENMSLIDLLIDSIVEKNQPITWPQLDKQVNTSTITSSSTPHHPSATTSAATIRKNEDIIINIDDALANLPRVSNLSQPLFAQQVMDARRQGEEEEHLLLAQPF